MEYGESVQRMSFPKSRLLEKPFMYRLGKYVGANSTAPSDGINSFVFASRRYDKFNTNVLALQNVS